MVVDLVNFSTPQPSKVSLLLPALRSNEGFAESDVPAISKGLVVKLKVILAG